MAWDFTTIPVGRCLIWTAELVLFYLEKKKDRVSSCATGWLLLFPSGSGNPLKRGSDRGGERRIRAEEGAYNFLAARAATFDENLLDLVLGWRLGSRRQGILGEGGRCGEEAR